MSALRLYIAGRDEPLRATLDAVAEQVEFLNRLNEKDEVAKRLDLLDMLANADRRATMAQKYDDAVARLYSALEALARNRLLMAYGIKNGAIKLEQIPDNNKDRFQRFFDTEDSVFKLGLQASYQLLNALGDDLGKRYASRENELDKVLNIRNQSRLAHGTEPVRQETFEKMREILMEFAEARAEDLPRFPELKL